MLKLIPVLLLAALLGGCETTSTVSIAGGECKVFERPAFAVRGLARYDQSWINRQVEGGVGACGWKRPAPRPAELDAEPARKVAPAPKNRGVVARVKDAAKSIWPPVPAAPLAPPVTAAPAAEPPPKPRSAIDELLDPRGASR